MNNINDIKALWQTAETDDMPRPEEIMDTIKKYRLKQVLKRLLLIVFTLLLLAVMIRVVLLNNSTLLSTRFGEALLILAILFLTVTNVSALNRVAAQKDRTNKDFINYLNLEQLRLIVFYKRTQLIGMAIASSGLGLYIFEGISHDKTWLIIGYSLFSAYILVCWFIIRPIAFRNKTKKLRERIEKLERLSTQLQSTNINS